MRRYPHLDARDSPALEARDCIRFPCPTKPTTSITVGPSRSASQAFADATSLAATSIRRSRSRRHFKMFVTRAIARPTVMRETIDWSPMATFADLLIGIVSVGLNAVAFVKLRYR